MSRELHNDLQSTVLLIIYYCCFHEKGVFANLCVVCNIRRFGKVRISDTTITYARKEYSERITL